MLISLLPISMMLLILLKTISDRWQRDCCSIVWQSYGICCLRSQLLACHSYCYVIVKYCEYETQVLIAVFVTQQQHTFSQPIIKISNWRLKLIKLFVHSYVYVYRIPVTVVENALIMLVSESTKTKKYQRKSKVQIKSLSELSQNFHNAIVNGLIGLLTRENRFLIGLENPLENLEISLENPLKLLQNASLCSWLNTFVNIVIIVTKQLFRCQGNEQVTLTFNSNLRWEFRNVIHSSVKI